MGLELDGCCTLVSICGANFNDWVVHLWLDRVPFNMIPAMGAVWTFEATNHLQLIPSPYSPNQADYLQRRFCVNLELPEPDAARNWLLHLECQDGIWDPHPGRAALLQVLGFPCYWLPSQAKSNGWLAPTKRCFDLSAANLGLPNPLPCFGLCLGCGDAFWEHGLAAWEAEIPEQVLVYLPELPRLGADPNEARALAAWLQQAASLAEHTVLLTQDGFCAENALACLGQGQLRYFAAPISPVELVAELVGQPLAMAFDPFPPPLDTLWFHDSHGVAAASVVVSSFNYSNYILGALDSVRHQSLEALELIVVDDDSTDGSVDRVLSWLELYGQRFVRAVFLRHATNSGLAAARNTAFSNSKAPWCFVLDADNTLMPQAVAACLEVAQAAPQFAAVVHPHVEIIGSRSNDPGSSALITKLAWQRDSFLGGNIIDAMAMIRKEAWQEVGGYTHIDGGWEDFDFWCKLIGAGFHGVLCPRVLARYHAHLGSMTAKATSHQWRPLSRCLQRRHPWLQLPFAS
ncbi:glycosyltransferase family 2 protein [Cyanobium sp. HWJ4-Hawea]|uniref:glycosyltransferase family 2 protein n=1 Tax=Cyanobium sp. HWJ4-Hawea TaxID=2823713 RepID=UPI0020CD65CF|nr:glycosyltransferase family A protein [Cyanobium sp. HWJ4-Hawea]MCP9809141.1 glycosyltransferase family 2 protein [Cyanobium sp. HWJ4-Hawea]